MSRGASVRARPSPATRGRAPASSSDLVFSSGAYGAVVEIERATGRLRVLRLAAVDDAGTIVNPLLAEGQVIGGSAQGLGQCLVEEAVYDEEGNPTFASFVGYSLLTAAEMPPVADRVRRVAVAAQPARREGDRRGRRDRDAGRGGERGRRRARRRAGRSAVHRGEALAGAARGGRVKPPPFEYRGPGVGRRGAAAARADSAVLAGGQSLVPLLNLRLARPELRGRHQRARGARLHPRRRRRAADRGDDAPGRARALRARPASAGRCSTRRSGSSGIRRSAAAARSGGSVAHADPAAELPAALIALGARFHLRSPGGARALDAAELFLGPLYTAREPDELLVEIEVPEQPDGRGQRLRRARAHARRLRDGGRGRRGRARRPCRRSRCSARGRSRRAPRRPSGRWSDGADAARGRRARRAGRRGRAPARALHGAGAPGDRGGAGVRISVEINGRAYEGDVEPRTLLSDFIRHGAGLTGTKVGCEQGVCGACTVQLDGEPVRSCLMLAVQANGRALTDRRGARRRRRAAPAPARLPRGARAPVRVLHAGLPDVDGGVPARAPGRGRGGAARGARRQPLPLHGLPRDHRGGRARRPGDEGGRCSGD